MTHAEVDIWRGLLDRGPSSLSRSMLDHLEPQMSADGRRMLGLLLDSIDREKKWIVQRTAEMRDEAERITLIGETMRRAGLRSYTDKGGCVFIAAAKDGA